MKENAIVVPPKPNFKGLKEGSEEFKARSREIRTWRLKYEPGFKDKTKQYSHEYAQKHASRIKQINNLPENILKRNRLQNERRRKNYSKSREYHKRYFNERYYNDPVFKLNHILRVSIKDCIREGFLRDSFTLKPIGCNVGELKKFIEHQFKEGMSWENHGKTWHIDHILPLALAKEYSLEISSIWHYTNLQPLEAGANLSKHHCVSKKYLEKILAHPDAPDELVDVVLVLLSY